VDPEGIHRPRLTPAAAQKAREDQALHQRLAEAGAVKAGQDVDAFELDVAAVACAAGQVGGAEQGEADRRPAGRFAEPRRGAVAQVVAIGIGAVGAGAMIDNRLAVENAREGFEEGRGADQREAAGVVGGGGANLPV
jgi:hypothetical protein